MSFSRTGVYPGFSLGNSLAELQTTLFKICIHTYIYLKRINFILRTTA